MRVILKQHCFKVFFSVLAASAFLSNHRKPNPSSIFVNGFSASTKTGFDFTIHICENKHCMKQQNSGVSGRWNTKKRCLVDVVEDLTQGSRTSIDSSEKKSITISVERSGCLSECGKGPNICIIQNGKSTTETLLHGIDGPFAVALALKDSCNYDVNKVLLAACTLMDQAEEEPSTARKETLLDSVVSSLLKNELSMSSAMASALCLRAATRSSLKNFTGSIGDASQSTFIRPKSNPKAWRLLFEGQEATGDLDGAIDTLDRWSKVDPQFSRKATQEAKRIQLEHHPKEF